ncbi:ABC transporter substrate-binding protein [Ramlibacter sp. RBP-2]|uniref:ABC transporter substrate-binding protein n=1 Tax=Ramlibacter lithotrophicus TaxID=2606681 RepID=A0A7X6I4F1_9BURK|nr:ABC transporter substrate-binding protein [Ramlibacter lithotrophicus]NKE64298.1 ABC transporter substrate-binding protein [Ramlibacter lithotrophicus]
MTITTTGGRAALAACKAAAAIAIGLTLAAAPPQAAAQKRSATLVFAQEATPPTLDPYFSSSIATRNVAMHIFEQLVTRGESNQVIPELAESWKVSDDGLTYTFKIRTGVKFHNGKELTSADVKASFERYKRMALARVSLAPVATMTAPDRNTFVITLTKPQPIFLEELSAFVVPIAILPAEQADREGNKIDLIGTGPMQFVEWVPDSHIRLKRFDGYKPDTRYKGNEGFGGQKNVWFDTVDFKIVKEPGARVAGLESGQLQIIEDLPPESAKRLAGNKSLVLYDLKNFWLHGAWVNHHRPPTNDLKVRRAMQLALDMEEIMEISTDGAYAVQPGLQYPGNPYYVTDGKEFYNARDPKKAAALLKESGYKGEELVIITNSSYQSMYKAAQIVSEQLKAVGFKVRVDVFDWATAMKRRADKDVWNLWFTGQGSGPSVGPFSAMKDVVSPQKNQVVADPEIDKLYADLVSGTTVDARKATFGKFQSRVYEQVLFLKFGDLYRKQAARSNIKGFAPYRIPRLWNVWDEGAR